jgi:hypothetical protein
MGRHDDDDEVFELDDDDSGVDPGGTDERRHPDFVSVADAADANPDDSEDGTRLDKKRRRKSLIDAHQEQVAINRELTERLARMEGAQSQVGQLLASQNRQQQIDPLEQELLNSLEEDRRLQKYAADKIASAQKAGRALSEDELRVLQDAATANSLKQQRIIARQEARAVASTINPRDVAMEVLQTKHNDVRGNPKAFGWAKARYEMAVAEGAKDSPELLDRVMGETRARFSMPGARPKPSDSDRRRTTGVVGSGGGGADVRRNGGRVLTDQERKIAEAAYPFMPGPKAHATWLKKYGSDDKQT